MPEPPHSKTIQHFNVAGHAHLLTFSCYKRLPLLTNDTWRTWLSEGITRTLEKQRFTLIAFVYMPEHLHLLIFPTDDTCAIEQLLFAVKRPFSFKVKRALEESHSPLLQKLTIRDRPNHTSFRFWQEGPGHDRNLISAKNCLKAAEYIHNNPVRRGLCSTADRWRWSSWKFYHASDEYVRDQGLPRVHGFPG